MSKKYSMSILKLPKGGFFRLREHKMRYVQELNAQGVWVTSNPNKIISSPDAAKLLRIKPQTLRKWRMEGRGPKISQMGKRSGYRMKDVVEFINREVDILK